MQRAKQLLPAALWLALGLPLLLTSTALAADPDLTQIQGFIHSIINVGVSIAGLVATCFFVAGGFGYITSSGDPERLERSKHTLLYAAVGLTIVIAAFVMSNLVTTLATNAFGS